MKKQPVVGWTAVGLAAVYTGLLTYWLPKGKFHDFETMADDTETNAV
jgi:hypothetical protein